MSWPSALSTLRGVVQTLGWMGKETQVTGPAQGPVFGFIGVLPYVGDRRYRWPLKITMLWQPS